ncbi:cilia- and flagella-associated protein 44 [Xyrauchen texanus]|uniref:cilia- and flagella-associated protein 44 n=1 Tax=Xyrauchen texanus TaxID=154827 RepID=UPI0022426B6C|nr:cilia- and flagella-associated protein 44 [Xyrauchen texanus]
MDASETLDDKVALQDQSDSQAFEECGGNFQMFPRCSLPDDLYYSYEELCSRPFITADSNIPQNLLHLSHSFGYDCGRRGNLQLLDEHTLAFIAGNQLILLDVHTKEQRYIRSSSGGGIGAIMTHPSKQYFAVGEKGHQPNIIIYEYPSLRPYRILRGGTGSSYSFMGFNRDGTLLASVGGAPDYMLTLWDWMQEQVTLCNKAFSQDIYRVSFSPDCAGQLTTSGSGHIRFWKMASTFTGLKLQGYLGRFGKTTVTDIEGYVELPDGKVVSGSEWGNMLLWEGGLIKVEICRKGGRTCHTGTIHQFILDEGELMTIGSDGAVRGWNLETIDAADSVDDSGLFEIEPMNELIIGHNVSLSSMVKSSMPETSIWFAQDSNGGFWKLDLSFSNITQDPECLFSFHAGAIQGMDVSGSSHLMATTSLDSSVRVFDFLSKKELTISRFKQGGTTLTWASDMVNSAGALLVVGFNDGVVRLLELYNPRSLNAVAGRSQLGDAELRLRQALKPHNAPVTAIAYERTGKIMATGSTDCTVFFFTVGNRYEPIGFITVPGPVQCLEWSPQSHEKNTLLIFCRNGHVMEVQCPDLSAQTGGNTYQLSDLHIMNFCFSSIKSRIKRDAEVALRQARKEQKMKEREERLKKLREQKPDSIDEKLKEEETEEDEEEEEEELPPIYIPSPPSPLQCGFSSTPGAFWLSMGGYDSGYLYHCKFSELQSKNPLEGRDEPFSFIPVHNTDHNPILTINFNSSRQMMLCGMEDGSIRAYPIQASDHQLSSMQAYWALSVHDNQYGRICHIRCSYDDMFVLTAGEDGNIFSFSCLPEEELQSAMQTKHAKVPSPRVGLEMEKAAQDIEDPSAYSIETAKQKLELDRMHKEAEQRKEERRKKLMGLQSRFQALLEQNQSLPEHIRLHHSEFELDPRFHEDIERQIEERVMEVRKELAWEEERHRIGLNKLQAMFWESVAQDTVTLYAFESGHKISTYRLLALPVIQKHQQLHQHSRAASQSGHAEQERWQNKARLGKVSSSISLQDELVTDQMIQSGAMKSGSRKLASSDAEKLRKAAEKAEKARARIDKRKKEWAEFYASKPSEDYEDPKDVEAIRLAKEKIGDFKLKSAKDFNVPEHLRMNVEKKRVQLEELEKKIYEKKSEVNARVMALRDRKLEIISEIHSNVEQLQLVQQLLPPEKHCPLPAVPVIMPEEIPERKHRYTRATLERFATLRAKMVSTGLDEKQEGGRDILELLEQETQVTNTAVQITHLKNGGVETQSQKQEEELTELEKEMREVEEIRNLYKQDKLLKQMEEAVWRFDAELRVLRHEKQELDVQMKLADLRHVTLFEELLLMKEFEKRENVLQERLTTYILEEEEIRAKIRECKQQMEVKKRDILRLQGKDKALTATFQASLGENNKFEEFLTRVFKKKIKRVKKKEPNGSDVGDVGEEEEDSDEDSDEESYRDNDEDYDGSEIGAPLDDSVCPPNCDPELFENTLRLRENRLDVEEQLLEEMKINDSLKKDCDALAKKEKIVQINRKAAEGDLELINREKQQRLNEVDVVVPLRLHQIEYVNNGLLPGKLNSALVLNTHDLERLQKRIKELQQEKNEQRELYKHARQQHVQLRHDLKDMEARIKESEVRCEQVMMMKFGKLVELEVLQTLSGNRKLEEMRQEIREQEGKYTQELKHWEAKLIEARETLTEVTRQNTERLRKMNSLLSQKKTLEDQLNSGQMKTVTQFHGHQLAEKQELQSLQQLIEAQAQDIEALNLEIHALSRKDGHIVPPLEPVLPPLPTLPHRLTASTHTQSGVHRKHNLSSKAVK